MGPRRASAARQLGDNVAHVVGLVDLARTRSRSTIRCFVLVDLKLGKLTYQDLDQMQMYVNFYDRFQRSEGEAKTIELRFAIMSAISERARKLLHDAMDLSVSERAELAADLLASLDGEPEVDVEAAWASEVERRAREALTNPDDDVAWETVRAELHAAPTR